MMKSGRHKSLKHSGLKSVQVQILLAVLADDVYRLFLGIAIYVVFYFFILW